MYKFELPYPPADLSPNSRKKHVYTADTRSKFRGACAALTREALGRARVSAPIHLDLTFFPPDMRKRDLDNMFAALKSGIDGIADAIGVDDCEFSYTIRKAKTKARGGRVTVFLTHGEADTWQRIGEVLGAVEGFVK